MSEAYINPFIDRSEIGRAAAKLESILKTCSIDATNIAVVGSAALGIQISSSDIDFAVGTSQTKEEILARLSQCLEFRGERPATAHSTRLLFCHTIEGRHVDLNIMTFADLELLQKNISNASTQLSAQDRKHIVQRKTQLRDKKLDRELDEYKTDLYRRFCPDFLWTTDDQIVKRLAEDLLRRGQPLPPWLSDKLCALK